MVRSFSASTYQQDLPLQAVLLTGALSAWMDVGP